MELATGIGTVVSAVKGVLDALAMVKAEAGAIHDIGGQASLDRRRLAKQLRDLEDVLQETKAEYQGKGFPAELKARADLKELKQQVRKVEDEFRELQNLIPGLVVDIYRTGRGGRFTIAEKIRRALRSPTWVAHLSAANKTLRYMLKAARDGGFFQFAYTYWDRLPRLYIRPEGLYKMLVDHLRCVAPQDGAHGVLIWGGEGIGINSLARDIAHSFAFEPDLSECFPDGVFKLSCGEGDAGTVESLQRALLDKLQGRQNQDPGIRSQEGQDTSYRLGLELKGQRCLIWLDDVKDPEVVDACCPDGFAGALLLTSNDANAIGSKLRNCDSFHVTSELFWTADENSGDRIASKILAVTAANNVNNDTFPPGCEGVGQEIVDQCKGSVLALVAVGNYLHGMKTFQEWASVKERLSSVLRNSGYEYSSTVFAVLDVVLASLSDIEREIILALWQFRPGAIIPFPLLKLAVQVETGREMTSADLEASLEKIVMANLLEVCEEAAFMCTSNGRKGYRLPDLVGVWLTERSKDRIPEPLFWERRDRGGQSTLQQAGAGEVNSTAVKVQRRRRLLDAFLCTYGKVEGSLNVPQRAERFLKAALGLEFDGWADPSLSLDVRAAAKLACGIEKVLDEREVIAATLACRGAAKKNSGRLMDMGMPVEALPDLDQADRLQPHDVFTLKYRGAVNLAMGRKAEALRDLDEADRLQPNDAFTLTYRGATKEALCRLDEALQDLDAAQKLSGEHNADALALRAAVRLQRRDSGGARQDVQAARAAQQAQQALPPLEQKRGTLDIEAVFQFTKVAELRNCTKVAAIAALAWQNQEIQKKDLVTSCKQYISEEEAELACSTSAEARIFTEVHRGSGSVKLQDHIASALRQLEILNLSKYEKLWVLPDTINQLVALKRLDLSGCPQLSAIPDTIGELTGLMVLNLSQCPQLCSLPGSLGKLGHLQLLNLANCKKLRALPASLVTLKSLEELDLLNNEQLLLPRWLFDLPNLRKMILPSGECQSDILSDKGKRWLWKRIQLSEQQNAAREMLLLGQKSILATLERFLGRLCCWLRNLYTATFIAFLQPPGGTDSTTHKVFSGNETSCFHGWNEASGGIDERRLCAMFWFFILDVLRFGLSLSCIMMIVAMSMPRIPYKNQYYEVGRMWLLLVTTWGLLWMAVITGALSFMLSGFAVVTHWEVVYVPLLVALCLIMLISLYGYSRFLFRMFPGSSSLRAVLTGKDKDEEVRIPGSYLDAGEHMSDPRQKWAVPRAPYYDVEAGEQKRGALKNRLVPGDMSYDVEAGQQKSRPPKNRFVPGIPSGTVFRSGRKVTLPDRPRRASARENMNRKNP
eukprot:jgi/Botrbrau1/412/Bobra.110_2s0062.1